MISTASILAGTAVAVLGVLAARGHLGFPGALAAGGNPLTAASQPSATLLDGDVSFEEYEAGFQAMTACVAGFGWVPTSPPSLTRRQVYEYEFSIPDAGRNASPAQREKWELGFTDCRVTHFDAVQRAWEEKMVMSEAERHQARDVLGACMTAQGVQIAEHPDSADMQPFIRLGPGSDARVGQVFRSCLHSTQSEFGLRQSDVP